MNTLVNHCSLFYISFISSSILLQAASEDRRTQALYNEVKSKICQPRLPIGNRREYLGDEQKETLNLMLEQAQPTNPIGFTEGIAMMLFSGPPGTGKTYFAKGCVGEINTGNQHQYKFLDIEAKTFDQGPTSEKHMRIKAVIDCLKSNRPIIAVINELDPFKSRNDPSIDLYSQLESIKNFKDICVIVATSEQLKANSDLKDCFGLIVHFHYLSDTTQISNFIQHNLNSPGYSFSPDIVWPHTSFYQRYIRRIDLSHREIEFLVTLAKGYAGATRTNSSAQRVVAQKHVNTAWEKVLKKRHRPWITEEAWSKTKNSLGIAVVVAGIYNSMKTSSHNQQPQSTRENSSEP